MKSPPTLKECEDYVKEKNLLVDPEFFCNYFEASDPPWHDSKGKPVKSWKQKMWTWHRMNLERGGNHPCLTCGKAGVYIGGKDRDGYPYYYCIDHKPKPKPTLPKSLTNGILKRMEPEPDLNTKRNRALDTLRRN